MVLREGGYKHTLSIGVQLGSVRDWLIALANSQANPFQPKVN